MADTDPMTDVSALTVQLLSAYLANNTVPSENLAELIRSTKAALTEAATPDVESLEAEHFTPAVSTRKSLASPEHIISLIDGKSYKTLKRHLASHGLTPETYRSRYNLPASYPMVAPAYADHRRAVAKRLGLGRKVPASQAALEQTPAPVALPEPQPAATASVAEEAKKSKTAPGGRAPRRSKKAAGKAGGSADAIALPAAATNDEAAQPSKDAAPPVNAKPIRRIGKGQRTDQVRSPKKSTPASEPSGPQVDVAVAETPAMGTDNGSPAAATPTSKRRGKIGLFNGKAKAASASSSADGAQSDRVAQSGDETASVDRTATKSAAKARTPKRMARPPKPEVT